MKRVILRVGILTLAFIGTFFSVYAYGVISGDSGKNNEMLYSQISSIINHRKEDNYKEIQENHANKEREKEGKKDGDDKEGSIEEGYIEESKDITDEENSLNVFKVDRYSLLTKITIKEKLKLLSIISLNLNAGEIKKLYSMINDKESSDVEIVKKFDSYLKERLREKDYNKLRELAGKYINFDAAYK